MRSERRHELQDNVLAEDLGKSWEFLKTNGPRIAGVVVLVAVAALAMYLYFRNRSTAIEQVRTSYGQVLTLSDRMEPAERVSRLEELLNQSRVPRVAAEACFLLGKEFHSRAVQAGLDQGEEDANRAGSYYTRVLREFSDFAPTVAQARMGLARLAEDRGEFQDARKQYQAIIDDESLAGYPVRTSAREGLAGIEHFSRNVVRMARATPENVTTTPAGPSLRPEDLELPADDSAPVDDANVPGLLDAID